MATQVPPSESPRTSQEALALSIERAVQRELPAPDSALAIRASVEETLRAQACKNERLLGYARALLLGFATLVGYAVSVRPALAGIDYFPRGVVILTLIWTAIALLVAAVLSRGWYRRWLRWAAPILDVLIIVSIFVLQLYESYPREERLPLGSTGIAAVTCALLALTGALRLSRKAARLATSLSVVAWIGIAFLGRLLWLPAAVIAVLVLVTGILASRVGRMVRRVIVDEVTRLRLVQMYQDAQAAINAREEVLKIVSHDLRDPLGTIAMTANLLLDRPTIDERGARHLGIIKRAGERMNRLIHDVLDAARIEAGRLPIETRVVSVTEIFEAVVETLEPLATEQSLRLVVSAYDRLPTVRADPDRIVQVFSNLIGNAIKFTPAGGQITLRAERMGEKVRVSVADTGPGIPPDQLSEIFGRMWQASRNDTRGIGLGLTIAKAIVEAHGERIGVESRVGEGTEFWFTMAVTPTPARPRAGKYPDGAETSSSAESFDQSP